MTVFGDIKFLVMIFGIENVFEIVQWQDIYFGYIEQIYWTAVGNTPNGHILIRFFFSKEPVLQ